MAIEQKNKSILNRAVNYGKRKTPHKKTIRAFLRKQEIQLFPAIETFNKDREKGV
jgi:hypothetical protein